MARSLTIKHTEKPGTSGLFNGFLILAACWLGMAMLGSALSIGDADAAAEVDVP